MADGDAQIRGAISVSANGSNDGPGAATLGAGASGSGCLQNPWWGIPAWGGVHAGYYGTAVPFSLEDGSPGGRFTMMTELWNFPQILPCQQVAWRDLGGGGSVLLAGQRGVTVHASGEVRAGFGFLMAVGIVRFEAYGQTPVVLGTVTP
ncbi:MAG: hypothetical protein JNK49_16325 [Planctomycetes bacterium]|nr:hypothetical protein [Planctomycetota bacterium]